MKVNKYDKQLSIKRLRDGRIRIYRKSPYNSLREHDILNLENSYFGSGRWIRNKLIQMDTQRQSIVQKVYDNNKKIQERKDDDRITREIADFIKSGGDKIIT